MLYNAVFIVKAIVGTGVIGASQEPLHLVPAAELIVRESTSATAGARGPQNGNAKGKKT